MLFLQVSEQRQGLGQIGGLSRQLLESGGKCVELGTDLRLRRRVGDALDCSSDAGGQGDDVGGERALVVTDFLAGLRESANAERRERGGAVRAELRADL